MRRLLLLLLLLPSLAHAEGGIIMTNIAAVPISLELLTSAAISTDYVCSWADHTTTTFVPGQSDGNIATATTTTIIAAPAANEQRQVKACSIWNRSTTTAQTVTFKYDVNATERFLYSATMQPGESVYYSETRGFVPRDANGRDKITSTLTAGTSATTFGYMKTSLGLDTVGYWVLFAKDAGNPGAWLPPAPGINGFDTDCSAATNNADPYGATEMGAQWLQDPAAGGWYLQQSVIQAAQVASFKWIDIVWIETGLTVTTTTTQAVTSGALVARDDNGSADGEGYKIALYALTALGNAAAVSNTTLTYVDSAGNAGNTATFQAVVGMQAPATPVIGTFMPFSLAAGDRGIRSISEITLGTTYTSGTMALIIYRELGSIFVPIANSAGYLQPPVGFATQPGVRVWNNSCIHLIQTGPAPNAVVPTGTYTLVNQ